MPIAFYRCEKCRREYPNLEGAEQCEQGHLAPVSAKVNSYGVHKFPYSIDVTFTNGETREYVAHQLQ